jgi:hypothetical protein
MFLKWQGKEFAQLGWMWQIHAPLRGSQMGVFLTVWVALIRVVTLPILGIWPYNNIFWELALCFFSTQVINLKLGLQKVSIDVKLCCAFCSNKSNSTHSRHLALQQYFLRVSSLLFSTQVINLKLGLQKVSIDVRLCCAFC